MKTLKTIMKILADHKEELVEKYHIKEIGIFGSYIKNEQRKNSDVDILIDFVEAPTLITFINLENYLSDLLKVKVDLVMKKVLKPNIGKVILDEVIKI